MSLTDSGPAFLRTWLFWTAGFLAFPVAGAVGTAAAGRVDDPLAALIGGTVVGVGIGIGQVLASRQRLDPRRWIPATAAGMGLGLLLGAVVVDYRTSLGSLTLMGALTGVTLGTAQALVLPAHAQRRWIWAAAMPAMWALGWTVTTVAGISVEDQFTIFGASGALAFSALSGLLLHHLVPHPPAPGSSPTPGRVEAVV